MPKKENTKSSPKIINSPKQPKLTGFGRTIPKPPTDLKPNIKPKK